MKNKITIKDIASALGIHHATVSRALRNDRRISENTRKKIVAYAQEKGYQLNRSAVNFRNKQSNEIALIVPNISHYTFSNFISLFSDLAQQNNYVVSVFQSKENQSVEKSIVKTIMQNRVAGVIASVSNTTVDISHFQQLIDFGIPLVFFDRVVEDIDTFKVKADNFGAAFNSVNYLIERGYNRIVHITGPELVSVFKERNAGYQKAINEAGINYLKSYVVNKEFKISDGADAMKQLWNGKDRPNAVLCDSFTLSAGVNAYCSVNNILVPKELAILAIANDPLSALLNPPQTVMQQPIAEMVESSFSFFQNAVINNNPLNQEKRYHKTRLIIRKST